MSSSLRYTNIAILFHWLMALLIIGVFFMGLYMVGLQVSPAKLKFYSWHKWIGVTIFTLAVFRLWWRLRMTPPAMPVMPIWHQQAATATHWVLYFLFFFVPVTGWVFSSAKGFSTILFGVLPIPDLIQKNDVLAPSIKQVHLFASYSMAILIGMHSLAAIKHQFIDKDGLMHRIMPGSN